MGGGTRRGGGSDQFKSAFGDMLAQQQDSGAMKPSSRGGLFGSGMDGNEFVDVLTRAAALAQGDYGSAAQISSLIAKPKRDQQKRDEDFEDWKRQYDYQVENAKPVNNDTVADYEYIRQNLGEEAARTFLQNKADPPQYRQGPDGQFYRIATTAPPPITEDDWNSAQPIGGPAAPPPATFPGQPPRRRNR